ncbi:MAG: hypothetical protein J6U62_05310 [Bacteroidaceae bacterium]|nr:hypothetical protein [Bacteroidaceae bacterium]
MKKINSEHTPQSLRDGSPKRRGAIYTFMLLLLVALVSCVDNSTTLPQDGDGVYYGDLTVGDYTDRVGISVTETSDSTVDVFFDNVKFAKAMPLRIDITVKSIPSRKVGGVLSFSVENVDPYMNREVEPQPEYRFATISGVIEGDELTLVAKMADDLKGSRAGKEFSFKGIGN